MVPLDLKALSQRAERVVYASVESSESHWTQNHDAIYTDVHLRVKRVYKGADREGDLVVVRREGGTVDGIGMRVFGAPVFTPGEEAVVFMETRGTASWVVGMAQGKLRVVTRADGTKVAMPPEVRSIHFVNGQPAPAEPRALETIERDIRTYVKAAP
jgi:hypothetical protein